MEKDKKKTVQLSDRLLSIAQMVTEGSRVADIGTDHGFVPIYLVTENVAPSVLAMDVRTGPLDRAKEHIEEYGLNDKIETRLSDGMEKLKAGEADTVICAGMGGPLMQRIVSDGQPREKGVKEMILQPQSELMEFRHFLRDSKFNVLAEKALYEDGKYYFIIKVECTITENMPIYKDMTDVFTEKTGCSEEDATRICDRFGPFLLKEKSEVLKDYISHGIDVAQSILEKLPIDMKGDRRKEIENELKDLQVAYSLF